MIHSRAKRLLTLVALLFVFSLSHVIAQQSTETRVFNVSVVDDHSRPYPGLKAEDFSAWVDNSPRKVVGVSVENRPASVGLLFDVSRSMAAESKTKGEEFARRLRHEIYRFLEISNHENEYFASVFDARVAQTERWTGPDISVLSKLTPPGNRGGTLLYDAMYLGIKNVMSGRHSRRVILVITDGYDNGSKRKRKEILELIKRSDVTVYALGISLAEFPLREDGSRVLDDFAEASGGRAIVFSSETKPKEVTEVFDLIAANVRNHYRLAVESDNVVEPEKWRKFKVRLNPPKQKGRPALWVFSRKGFYQ